MNESDTPISDQWLKGYDDNEMTLDAYRVMQELERELTAAQAEIAEWRILNGWGGTPEIINDFIKGQQTRIHYAQNLDEELTAVTEQREYWANLWADLARECVKDIAKVEREVVTLTQQRDDWKEKYIQQNKDLGHELRDPNGTIWSECKRLQTELNAARAEIEAVTEQRDGLRSGIDYASDQLHTVTEQRDELLRYNEAFRKETLICADCDAIRKEEYDQAIEQRDRLAEALREMQYCHIDKAERMANEALQSLTTNEQ